MGSVKFGATMLAFVMALGCGTAAAASRPELKLPAETEAGDPFDVTVTMSKRGKRDKKFRGPVSITADDSQAELPAAHRYKRGDKGRFVFRDIVLRTAGEVTVSATAGSRSASKAVDVAAGPATAIEVTPPASATDPPAPSGVDADFSPLHPLQPSSTYSVTGSDQFGNDLGNLTGAASWGITPDGGCVGSTCHPAAPGAHTVTATVGTASDTAAMTVAPLASTFSMSCQGENYDLDQALGNGCEEADPNPGRGTADTASYMGQIDDCDGSGQTWTATLLTDSRTHTNPVVDGFDTVAGGAPEFFKINADDTVGCAIGYEIKVTASGGAAHPSDCYRVNATWTYLSGFATNPPGSDSGMLSGNNTLLLEGDVDSGASFPNTDDSAGFLIEIEPICSPPRHERVHFDVEVHF